MLLARDCMLSRTRPPLSAFSHTLGDGQNRSRLDLRFPSSSLQLLTDARLTTGLSTSPRNAHGGFSGTGDGDDADVRGTEADRLCSTFVLPAVVSVITGSGQLSHRRGECQGHNLDSRHTCGCALPSRDREPAIRCGLLPGPLTCHWDEFWSFGRRRHQRQRGWVFSRPPHFFEKKAGCRR